MGKDDKEKENSHLLKSDSSDSSESEDDHSHKHKKEKHKKKEKSCFKKYFPILSFKFFRPYFKCTDSEIIKRIMYAFFLQKKKFMDEIKKKPDLFNPIWISFSLIISLAILSNIHGFINENLETDEEVDYAFKYDHLGTAMTLIIGYAFFIPFCFYLFLRFLGLKLNKHKIIQLFSLYSYSNLFLLVAVLFCFIPNTALVFIILIAGGVFSVLFLLIAFSEFLDQFKGRFHYISIGILILGQSLVILSLRSKFFSKVSLKYIRN